ncbi:dihydrodipicolinate reductase [Mycobacterium sp.]|uniref:NAD(P)H-dependent amine dehydrogenase family protein n=1 Tax=Mycobacterium sp. TaxID=1785 RepID=UPI0025CDC297|nr:dihydrodipicolinate reductase [Mycobacterium sp.]
MTPYRVVQWATGNVGRHSLRAVLERDQFEVVGVHAFSADKIGTDAGTLAGIDPVGVVATDDVDALIGAVPDCVLYTPRVVDYELVCRLLESGINVVTTGDFLTGSHHPKELAALTAAATAGETTFLGTGFEPGFINVVAGFLSGACRRVHSVKLVETLDCTQYPVREAWTVLGFAKPAKDRLVEFDPSSARYGLGYFESLDLVASLLGVELEAKQGLIENAVTTRDLDLGWIAFAKGTVAGQRRTYRGYRNGRVVVELAICWTMSDEALEPQWTDPEGFAVEIEGEPRVDAVIHFGPPHDAALSGEQSIMGLLMVGTAMAAVNAIPDVCAASPGVITHVDLPIRGSRGALID